MRWVGRGVKGNYRRGRKIGKRKEGGDGRREGSSKNGVGALRSRQDGGLIVSDEDRANALNNYFGSVCEEDDGSMPTITCALPDSAHIDDIDFSPLKVLAAMRKLKKTVNQVDLTGSLPYFLKKSPPRLLGLCHSYSHPSCPLAASPEPGPMPSLLRYTRVETHQKCLTTDPFH
jgi:hypothetical protein